MCFPHVGGGASFFRSWHDRLPPGVELLAVQYPGREERSREAFITDMAVMADAVTGALDAYRDEPLALFGHSMGAAVAYEVALRVGARPGHGLRGIVLSAQPSPRHLVPASSDRETDGVPWTDTMPFAGIAGTARSHRTLRRLLLPVLRSDYRLIETYRPRLGATVDCPVVVCLGDADPYVNVDGVRGWCEVTNRGFDLRVYPGGDHFYLRQEEHRRDLLAVLLGFLAEPA